MFKNIHIWLSEKNNSTFKKEFQRNFDLLIKLDKNTYTCIYNISYLKNSHIVFFEL